MSDNRSISQLTPGVPAQNTDELPLARAGTNVKLTVAELLAGTVKPTGVDFANDKLFRQSGTDGKLAKSTQIGIDDDEEMTGVKNITLSPGGASSDMDLFQMGSILGMTGLMGGGILAVAITPTQFSVTDGFGYIIDNTTDPDNPVYNKVTWTGKSNITVDVPANTITRIYIDANGDVQQQAGFFTPQQRRSLIVLGSVLTADGVFVNGVAQNADYGASIGNSLYDLMIALGNINLSGNLFENASTDLTLTKSSGETFLRSVNLEIDPMNPNQKLSSVLPTVSMFYFYRDGSGGGTLVPLSNDVDPDIWDDGTGVLATVGNNKWTNQRVFFFPVTGITVIQPGQEIFNSQAEAESEVNNPFEVIVPLNGQSVRTTISIEEGTTDLSNTANVTFTHTGMFGFGVGNSAAGGFGTQTMQDTYILSVIPQILTNAVQGALTIRQGSGSDLDLVLKSQNGVGTDTFSVNGAGKVVAASDVETAGGDFRVATNGKGLLHTLLGANNANLDIDFLNDITNNSIIRLFNATSTAGAGNKRLVLYSDPSTESIRLDAKTGEGTFAGAVLGNGGSRFNPMFAPDGDEDTGMYSDVANSIKLAAGSVLALDANASRVNIPIDLDVKGDTTLGNTAPTSINSLANDLVISTATHVGATLATTNSAATLNLYFAEGADSKIAEVSMKGSTHAQAGLMQIGTSVVGGEMFLLSGNGLLAAHIDSSQKFIGKGDGAFEGGLLDVGVALVEQGTINLHGPGSGIEGGEINLKGATAAFADWVVDTRNDELRMIAVETQDINIGMFNAGTGAFQLDIGVGAVVIKDTGDIDTIGGVSFDGKFNIGAAADLNVVAGAATYTQINHKVIPETGVSDTLHTINGGVDGDRIRLRTSVAGDTISLTNSSNLKLGVSPRIMSSVYHFIELEFVESVSGNRWVEMSFVLNS